MPTPTPPRLSLPAGSAKGRDVVALHGALTKLNLAVAPGEVSGRRVGPSTAAAIAQVQTDAGLPPTGTVDAATVDVIRRQVSHNFYTLSKTRTAKLQHMLAEAGHQTDPAEVQTRWFGDATKAALQAFQQAQGMPDNGTVDPTVWNSLEAAALASRLTSKTQAGRVQRQILTALRISGVDARVDQTELKSKVLGPTTQAAITALQEHYHLPQTGTLDPATYDKLVSIATSRPKPVAALSVQDATGLQRIPRSLRLNMTNTAVPPLQQALAFLGLTVDETEVKAATFGASTRKAVIDFQKSHGLPVDGHLNQATRNALNQLVIQANPAADTTTATRIRGSIRDERWQGKRGHTVEVWETGLRTDGIKLASRGTLTTGFYDVPFTPPTDPVTGQPKTAYQVLVRVLDSTGTELNRKTIINPTPVTWANFTDGDLRYRSDTDFDARTRAIAAVIGATPITSIEESDTHQDLSFVAARSNQSLDDVMRVVLTHRVAVNINDGHVSAEAIYAFIRQHLPPSMPSDLLGSTSQWSTIDALVENTARGIVFLDSTQQAAALTTAAQAGLVGPSVAVDRAALLGSLATLRTRYALTKSLLPGNGTLESLLSASTIPAANHVRVAQTFVEQRGMGENFWSHLTDNAAEFGGAAAVTDLRLTAQVAEIAKNHAPTTVFLKTNLSSPGSGVTKVSDLASLDHTAWTGLIQANGSQVPEGTPGATTAEQVANYAASMAAQSEHAFPGVALAASVSRTPNNGLDQIAAVQAFLGDHPDLDLMTTNVERFVQTAGLAVAQPVIDQTKALQRLHRIAPASDVATALVNAKITHATQAVVMGRDRTMSALTAQGVTPQAAAAVANRAELQYSQALSLLTDYHFALHMDDPAAIINHTWTLQEQHDAVGDVPDLQTLFGALGYCDCTKCQSLLSPSAYLVDILRYLRSHAAQTPPKTVADVLFDRRPDLTNIKLGCQNTNVTLPYIDLVSEILEAAVEGTPPVSYQSDADVSELRAFPANVTASVYNQLRTADHPMTRVFDLWQEEARAWLSLLGVPRWSLMKALQVRPAANPYAPTDSDIAAEFFGLSSHEADLVGVSRAAAADLEEVWQFDCTRSSIGVRELLDAGSVEYGELVQLIELAWINNGDNPMHIDASTSACDPGQQSVLGCTLARMDRLHRFIRLWRHTGWLAWQLDLLLRVPALAGGDARDAIAGLQAAATLATSFGLSLEQTAALFSDIDTLTHRDPTDLSTSAPSLYDRMFQNTAVTNPRDPDLALPLDPTKTVSSNSSAVMAALSLSKDDFDTLVAHTGDVLSVATLSAIYRTTVLAQHLHLRLPQLMDVLEAFGSDPFGSPAALLDFLEVWTDLTATRLSPDEIAFVLLRRPDSPLGLRDSTIGDFLAGLRDGLRTTAPEQVEGQLVSAVSAQFSLEAAQARLLVDSVAPEGVPLITTLTDPALTSLAADGSYLTPLTRSKLPALFAACDLLRKLALLLERLQVTTVEDTGWLVAHFVSIRSLDLSSLPTSAAPAAPLLLPLRRLAQWTALRAAYPEPESASLRRVLDVARATDAAGNPANTADDVLAGWAALTQVESGVLTALSDALQLKLEHDVNDFLDLSTYQRLSRGVSLLRRLGVDAATASAWVTRDGGAVDPPTIAAQTRQGAKARSDYAGWLSTATPIMDTLRESKRDALIATLIDRSFHTEPNTVVVGGKRWPNPLYWRDPDDLLRYFLIDVEMSSCQPTTRIKQAISSTQMFVQRCFLNLERPAVQVGSDQQTDITSLNAWHQWKWMKSYRLWVPARQVFFWPENWIKPELRDDKSPFFKELESELAQTDLTSDAAETALEHYLDKLNAVSRLQVLGVYHEVEDGSGAPTIDLLHVVAKTAADPAIHYYRAFDLINGSWSPWEQIDVDITGDHLMPVVYNKKLYLFWLSILSKPQKMSKLPPARASASSTPDEARSAPQQLEIQLAWSVRTRDGWTPKQLSRERLIHPWERPVHSYTLKPRYHGRENLLWLDLFITTSPEFNDTPFYDEWAGVNRLMTSVRSNETMRPWHSSSFLFDGKVVAAKMRALQGNYHLRKDPTKSTPTDVNRGYGVNDSTTFTTSWNYVHNGFTDVGKAIGFLDGPSENAPRLPLPDGLHYRFNRLTNNVQSNTQNTHRVAVLENGGTRQLLDLDPNPASRTAEFVRGPFELVFSQDHIAFDTAAWGLEPFLYQDERRSYFVSPEPHQTQISYNKVINDRAYRFRSFYHPYTALFLRELARGGVQGLLNRSIQSTPQTYYPGNSFSFDATYHPVPPSYADPSSAKDVVDFDRSGAYAVYNWELFFHIPFMIACRLMENERFEEATSWFHLVFDPTNVEGTETPQRFWVTKPFADTNADDYRKQRIENLLADIGVNLNQLRAWRNDPYNPHLIARFRPIAYQKTVVMRYLDNLITWGDRLYAQDTVESINEATTLYVLAQELLGPRPEAVPSTGHADLSWNDLLASGALNEFGNATIAQLESYANPPGVTPDPAHGGQPPPVITAETYFCIPPNATMLAYWPTVADRLFKIRHCMNLAGAVRQLPIYETPLDPALLVKAAAAGVDLNSVVSPSAVMSSEYRYRVLIGKATQLCGQVRELGSQVLSALEKRDAEQLALLRAGHESSVLQSSRLVNQDRIEEATQQIEGAQKAKDLAEQRRSYYQSREFINAWEGAALALSGTSALAETAIAVGYILAGGLRFIPNFVAGLSGFGGSPTATAEVVGGDKVGDAAEAAVKTLQAVATALDKFASLASTMGSYQRRKDEWDFQGDLATTESAQADIQLLAAQIRQSLAQHELDMLDTQIENAATVSQYLNDKYTNQQLYDWMLGQLASVYFQAYTQAFEMAQRAEAAFARDLGRTDLTFIQFGYWDSLRKGLLAGERLSGDLARMDAAYLRYNTRELELTKHISLAQFMPLSLLALKTSGTCTITLPEWLFDLDYPGHYRRRIASVGVTIPAVAGPWSGVHATLSLTNNAMRSDPTPTATYGDLLDPHGDGRFVSNAVSTTTIATSSGQNDSGMFELSFADDRYLPFEGGGAVSTWAMTLPEGGNSFNRDTITDVILHMHYRATAGSAELAELATDNLNLHLPNNGTRLFALKNEFGTAWARFLHPDAGSDQNLTFSLTTAQLPFYVRNQTATITSVDLFVDTTIPDPLECAVTVPGAAAQVSTANPDPTYGQLHHGTFAIHDASVVGDWTLTVRVAGIGDWHSLDPASISNAYLLVHFTLT